MILYDEVGKVMLEALNKKKKEKKNKEKVQLTYFGDIQFELDLIKEQGIRRRVRKSKDIIFQLCTVHLHFYLFHNAESPFGGAVHLCFYLFHNPESPFGGASMGRWLTCVPLSLSF